MFATQFSKCIAIVATQTRQCLAFAKMKVKAVKNVNCSLQNVMFHDRLINNVCVENLIEKLNELTAKAHRSINRNVLTKTATQNELFVPQNRI